MSSSNCCFLTCIQISQDAEQRFIFVPHSAWIIKKAREFQKNIYFCFIDYTKAFDCVDHNKLWEIRETYMQVRKQQLGLDMEQQTGSK